MEKFEALFQYASTGILIVNSTYEIVLANNFLINLFGYKNVDEVVGKKIELLIPSKYHKAHNTHTSNYSKNPQNRQMGIGKDLLAICKDGREFPVEVSLSNYTTNGEVFTIAFVNDITKRKEIENNVLLQKEQLAKTNLQIEELNNFLEKKVEERTEELQKTLKKLEKSKEELIQSLNKEKELGDLKSRFVTMASHEFRTPLSTILSSASLVAKYTETAQQENRDKHIQRIKNSVNNLTNLLNEFLSIGKIEDGKIISHFATFNIQEMLAATCNEMQVITKLHQKIIYSHKGTTTVNLDQSLLKNTILNLISNAIKFSSEEGNIIVTSEVTANGSTISITDNGIGISKEDQEHLFERFFRGTNAANIQGTGLGLHIVSKYVELMNGTINYTSELEKGTTFTIILPN